MSVMYYCPAPIPYVRDDFRTPSNRYDEAFFAKITKGKKLFLSQCGTIFNIKVNYLYI